jgi:hypothetical protein
MEHWFPEGFRLLLKLPILGHFRAPGRYTLLTSLGLCLLAGRGFDRLLDARRFWTGYGIAIVLGLVSIGWGFVWSQWPEVRNAMGEGSAEGFLLVGEVTWIVSLVVVGLWRTGKLSPWVPFLLTVCELAYLYHHGTTPWGKAVRFPEESPVFARLRSETDVGLIAGDLQDLPARVGMAAAYPNLGIIAPPPNYLLEMSRSPTGDPAINRRSRRFGVTHGVFEGNVPSRVCEILYVGPDPALDAMLPSKPETKFPRVWRVERYLDVFPEVRCARKVRLQEDWSRMYPAISTSDDPDVVEFLERDLPPDPPGPRATSARTLRWDGRGGEFEHDGTFDLVIRRTYVPGWVASINDGPSVPVVPVEGGLQSIRVPGAGKSRIRLSYEPIWLKRGAVISLTAVSAALMVVGFSVVGSLKRPRKSTAPAIG